MKNVSAHSLTVLKPEGEIFCDGV